MTVDKLRRFSAVPALVEWKVDSMNRHPQIEAFLQASESMHENRYWARDAGEQVEFLEALHDVMTEVCFHLDRNHVLDQKGLEAFLAACGGHNYGSWMRYSAETVLLPELDKAIQRSLAAMVVNDNTGGDAAF